MKTLLTNIFETRLVAVVCYGKDSTKQICHVLNQLRTPYRIILPHEPLDFCPTHVILSGGPISIKNEKEKSPFLPDVRRTSGEEHLQCSLPEWVPKCSARVLGICYGMLLIAHSFGGTINSVEKIEHGLSSVTEHINGHYVTKNRWMKRLDYVTELPPKFQETGRCASGITSFTDHNKWWGIHYHPEIYKHQDKNVFRRFLMIG